MVHLGFRERSGLGATALLFLAALCVATTVRADDVPAPSADVTSDYAFVGDPLRGLDSGEAGSLWGRSPDFIKGEASTTKSWAMCLVCKGVDVGLLELDDWVRMSSNALIPRGHGHSSVSGPSVPEKGDYYRLDDLLHSIMTDSASDGTLAASEFLAAAYAPSLSSAEREAYFVEYMNDAAWSIGLVDTVFYNPYGGDHTHDNWGGTGSSVNHVTTTREMAKWFAHAMADSETFREINAFRGDKSFWSQDGTKYHELNSYGPSYPGLLGHKPGGNASCDKCLVGGARRIGRDMAFGVMESDDQWDDESFLLDYAYATTFNPGLLSESEDGEAVKDYALATVSSTRAVAAVITEDDEFRMVTWAIDPEDQSMELITDHHSGPCEPGNASLQLGGGGRDDVRAPGAGGGPPDGGGRGYATRDDGDRGGDDRGGDDGGGSGGGRADAPGRQDGGKGGGRRGGGGPTAGPGGILNPGPGGLPPWSGGRDARAPGPEPGPFGPGGRWNDNEYPLSVDVVHVGSGNLIVAKQTNYGIALLSYGLPGCGVPYIRDTLGAGQREDVRLVTVGPGRFVLGHRDGTGLLVLRSYEIDLGTGHFVEGDQEGGAQWIQNAAIHVSEYDLAARPNPNGRANLVVASRDAGEVTARSWKVYLGGLIEFKQAMELGYGTAVAVTALGGWDNDNDFLVVAHRLWNDTLRLPMLELDESGLMTFHGGQIFGLPEVELAEDARVEISSFRENGVAVTYMPLHEDFGRMIVVSIDEDLNEDHDYDAWYVVGEDLFYSAGQPVTARLPTGKAEGDFLLLQNQFSEFHDERWLKLRLIRSGPRQ